MTRSFSTLTAYWQRLHQWRCAHLSASPDSGRQNSHPQDCCERVNARKPSVFTCSRSRPAPSSPFKIHSANIPKRLPSNGCIKSDPAIRSRRKPDDCAPDRFRYSTNVYRPYEKFRERRSSKRTTRPSRQVSAIQGINKPIVPDSNQLGRGQENDQTYLFVRNDARIVFLERRQRSTE
jgi:hypothetical protein